ncbi:MAG: cation transporter [Candidatus Gracilibacteria bacterium]
MEKEITIKITGMDCPSCASLIEISLGEISGVKKAEVDYPSAQAHVVFDDEQTDTDHLLESIEKSGYKAII